MKRHCGLCRQKYSIPCSLHFWKINWKLEDTSETEQKSHLYTDMIVLIEEITKYIILVQRIFNKYPIYNH